MSDSPHLGLGYLASAQAQKHVTVNEAFRRLDALVQLGVLDRTRTAPPASPDEGDRHIVAAGATGAWAGQATRIAAFLDGTWVFVEPKPGWLGYVADEGALLVFLSGAWVSALGSLASLEALTRLGVNATSDLVNRLAVASQAVLFNHDGAGVQVKLNKAAAADTASLLFQRGFSGRAEFGLAGTDDFSLKVSADGASWTSALAVDAVTGAVELPATPRVRIDKFTSSGTWTRPAWASRVAVTLIGAGAGGGSGAMRAAGVAASGGGGGGPAPVAAAEFLAADLPATVSITVGAGGAGGAAQTVADANGIDGAQGGASQFGTLLRTTTTSQMAGLGGGASAGTGGFTDGSRNMPPAKDSAGGAGGTGTGAAGGWGGGRNGAGGGGGGGLSAANAAGNGGASGYARVGVGAFSQSAGGSGAGSAGASGVASPVIATLLASGDSGGGGAAGYAAAGGAGGNGGAPGGSGGGGGAGRNGLASGKGGDGARGEAWIVSIR